MNREKMAVMVYIKVILAMMFWSMSYIWLKTIFLYINPITMVFLRLAAASLIMYVLGKATGRLQPIRGEDKRWVFLMAFFQPFAYFLFESFALKLVSPTPAAVITSTIPLFIPLAAARFYHERLSRLNIVGMIVSFAGVTQVVINPDLTMAAAPLGLLLLAGAVLSGVSFTIVTKRLTKGYNPYTLVTRQNIWGAIGFLPLFLFFDLPDFSRVPLTHKWLIPMSLLTVFSTIIAYVFYTNAIKFLGASKASSFSNSIPVFTAIFAWFFLGETMTTLKGAGVLMVITGLFISQIPANQKKTTASA